MVLVLVVPASVRPSGSGKNRMPTKTRISFPSGTLHSMGSYFTWPASWLHPRPSMQQRIARPASQCTASKESRTDWPEATETPWRRESEGCHSHSRSLRFTTAKYVRRNDRKATTCVTWALPTNAYSPARDGEPCLNTYRPRTSCVVHECWP